VNDYKNFVCLDISKKTKRKIIPEPVWAVGFALEQSFRVAALAVFRFLDFKTASAYSLTFSLFNKRKKQ
jgi:hypothetical protein